MRRPVLLAAVLTLAAAGCKEQPKAAPAAAPAPRIAFTLRDVALAMAVDARAAKLSLAASDVEAALGARAPGERARSRELVSGVDVARAELDRAIEAVANPMDRRVADEVGRLSRAYAQELAASATAGAAQGGLLSARDALARAIGAYRQVRAAWRLATPPPEGIERAFADGRRETELAESGLMSAAQDREPGAAAAARMRGEIAARRVKALAEQLPAGLYEPAVRWAAAEGRVLEAAVAVLAAPDRPASARAYHAAKTEALAALADYFAALAAR